VVVAGQPGQLRLDVDDAIARGEPTIARALLQRLWRDQPGPATASFVNSRTTRLPADPSRHAATLAVVRSFTVEPLVPVVRAAAAVHGLDLTVNVGDFGTYGQDLLDPGRPLHAQWNPDVVILATQTRDLAPELWDGFAELSADGVDEAVGLAVDQFSALIEGFRRLSDATLVVHGWEEPVHAALGIADAAAARSQRQAIRSINQRLGEVAATHRDVHVLDYDALVAAAGRGRWFDEQKWRAMKMPIRAEHLGDLAAEWLRFVFPSVGRIAKALVVDLDDTLWGGVLGEEGLDGIQVGPESGGPGYRSLQRSLLDLRARGVLLGVCSKNNEADAVDALQKHPEMLVSLDAFAATRINWDSKVENLKSIAGELNIGLDSIAFLDNSPFECDQVRHALPEVTVIELDRPPTETWNPVIGHPMFERLRLLDEDRQRAEYYAQQTRRQVALDRADSVDVYLQSLGTVVAIAEATSGEVVRVAQLTQKTNQFNLTTRRYAETEIERMVGDDETLVLVARARDRFGDHGLIGVVIADIALPTWSIDTMLLSCRVIGRGVETAVMSEVLERARAAGAHDVRGRYVPTAKNAPARDFYRDTGFDEVTSAADADGATSWTWPVADRRLDPPAWIELETQGLEVGA
jgi:FkbH-like protein